MNVLVSAYACHPEAGGEEAGGFFWAYENMRLGNRVWCLCQPRSRAPIEAYLAAHPAPAGASFEAVYVGVPAWTTYLYRWQFGVYVHYLVWQYRAWRRARQLLRAVAFDYAHHASYGSLQLGTWLWRLPVPLVFGPVGGGQRAPRAFRQYLPGWFQTETLRDAIGWLLLAAERNGRRAVRRAALTLAANADTAALAQRLGASRVELCLDSGLPASFVPTECPPRSPGPTLRLLWLARLFPRKALPLVLDALSQVAPRVPFHLTIIGDGPLAPRLPGWLAQYGLEGRATWRGAVPWVEVQAAMLTHDVFIFGSLRDAFAMQQLEAMATGLPLITLDHQGARDFIPAEAACKVPVTTPAATAAALARAVEFCHDHPDARARMGRAGHAFAQTQTWPRRAAWLDARVRRLLGQKQPAQGGHSELVEESRPRH